MARCDNSLISQRGLFDFDLYIFNDQSVKCRIILDQYQYFILFLSFIDFN